MIGLQIKIDASKALKKLKGFKAVYEREAKRGMFLAVTLVRSNVVPLTPVGVSSRLRGSIEGQVKTLGSEIRGIVDTSLKEIYPTVMELGRRPGAKMPPPSALERWVHLQLGVPNEEVMSVAFLVARAIARHGIKGRKFMKRGLAKSKVGINAIFKGVKEAIVKGVNRG